MLLPRLVTTAAQWHGTDQEEAADTTNLKEASQSSLVLKTYWMILYLVRDREGGREGGGGERGRGGGRERERERERGEREGERGEERGRGEEERERERILLHLINLFNYIIRWYNMCCALYG